MRRGNMSQGNSRQVAGRVLQSVLLLCVLILASSISFPRFSVPKMITTKSYDATGSSKMKSSLDTYKAQLYQDILKSIGRFTQQQNLTESDIMQRLDGYRLKIDQLYLNVSKTMIVQKDSLREIGTQFRRPSVLDRSLTDFRKFYNESNMQSWLNSISDKPLPSKWLTEMKDLPLNEQLEILNRKLTESWEHLVLSSKDAKKYTEDVVQKSSEEFIRFHRNLLRDSKTIEDNTLELFPRALSKSELKKVMRELESQLKKLEKDSNVWIDDRLQQFDTVLKKLQERILLNDNLYEEVLGKRKSALQYTIMNDMMMNKILQMIDDHDKGWDLVRSEDGIDVFRKFMSSNTIGSKYACVRCSVVINAPPLKVFELFEDNTRVKEYNSLFVEGKDLEIVAENTKIVWASSSPIFPLKPRDFCTVVHTRKLKDGTLVVLNRGTKHPAAPLTSKYVRANIIIGANIIQPIPNQPNKCRLTMITQADPGGIPPAVIVNHLCALGPVGFMKNVEAAVHRKPSQKVLEEKKKLGNNKLKF